MKKEEKKFKDEDNIYNYAKEIINKKNINVNFDSSRKAHLFALGLSFANGSSVSNINKEDLCLEGPKSFDKMLYIWWKNKLKPEFNPMTYDDHAFLICPVRDVDDYKKEKINKVVEDIEENGMLLHYPARDTNQKDDYGYRICLDNANAIRRSKHIYIYYDRASKGSFFDLGVAYYFQMKDPTRTFTLVNSDEIELSDDNIGDAIINSLLNFQCGYKKTRKTRKR